MRTDYNVKLVYASRELTAKEKIYCLDTSEAIGLNEVVQDGGLEIIPSWWYRLDVHNEHSNLSADYSQFVIVDDAGTRYRTGSSVLEDSFLELMELCEENQIPMEERQVQIKCGKTKGGNPFLTVSLV